MSERRCWCGNPIPLNRLQCECCASGDCEHRRKPLAAPGVPSSEPAAERTHSPLEAHVLEAPRQEEIRKELISAGWKVYRVGQRNAKGTQDPGPADLYCLKSGVGELWVECKRPHGGILSRAQIEFREECAAAGVAYVCASQVADLAPYLYASSIPRT